MNLNLSLDIIAQISTLSFLGQKSLYRVLNNARDQQFVKIFIRRKSKLTAFSYDTYSLLLNVLQLGTLYLK